ncbi:nitrite reductase (NADH) large subunit [Clostridium cavendishii DSM 21758]|uniref:Nitrite reductase (NADH) large subunit n=1 Tax=Clostridium cavendishii DSM 21758 TaxID=1121302 RepID=A0A1M6JFC9_9CLOT|nr:FAD-dependent oxidoreductase [Clostridium cavendishii]SHJ45393.1 nitrite reductase (NADH) large subunit [Clostridium cavendishii DSM 21758]
MPKSIVIVGSGIAAITAIKSIREIDLESDIYLIGEEKFYPYNRIRLSKGIFDELEENKILLQKKEWYENNKVKIFINTKVVNVDIDNKEVLLFDGRKIKYDKILFANGSSNTIPPIDGIGKAGVYTLRGLNDALSIKNRLDESKQIIIIGGGIQGLEMAWILHQHGKKVIIVELLSRLMPQLLDDNSSELLKKIIQDCGIQVVTSTKVKEIIGDTKVEGVLIDGKDKLECDIVIYSTGVKPNIELLENTNIKTARGIVVNDKMETNVKNVYAAGDIAEFNNKVVGLWNVAIAQGKVAGYNIAEKEELYENVIPVTTLNAFGISLFSMGCINETESTKVLVDENISRNQYKKIFIKNNKVVGAIVIGDIKQSPLLKGAIEKEIVLDEVDFTNISIEDLLNKLKK